MWSFERYLQKRIVWIEIYYIPLSSNRVSHWRQTGANDPKEMKLVFPPGDTKCMIEPLSMQTNASYKRLQRRIFQPTHCNRNKDQSVCYQKAKRPMNQRTNPFLFWKHVQQHAAACFRTTNLPKCTCIQHSMSHSYQPTQEHCRDGRSEKTSPCLPMKNTGCLSNALHKVDSKPAFHIGEVRIHSRMRVGGSPLLLSSPQLKVKMTRAKL